MPAIQSDHSSSLSESTPLLVASRRAVHVMSSSSKAAVALLLIMKLCSNMYENQMFMYDLTAFNETAAQVGLCINKKQAPQNMLNVVFIVMATASMVLPTLGGLLSDAFIGCLRTLWIGIGLQLWGSAMLTAFDVAGLLCRMPMYILAWLPVLISLGFSDPILLYAPLRIPSNSRTRQLVLCLYFAAAAIGETVGNLPAMLKYFTGMSYEFLGVIFGVCSALCMMLLTLRNKDAALSYENTANFIRPSGRMLRKFYLISAGTVPHLACVILCRCTFYCNQIRFFTSANGVEDGLASFIPLAGYQTASISLCLFGAAVIFMFGTPSRIGLMPRIRAGLCLMAASKVPLMLLSLLDFYQVINMASWSSFTVWAMYFAAAFCDGVANALTSLAIYELIYRVADSGAKATMLAIFYTVWALATFLNGAVLLSLQACGVLSLDRSNRMKPMSHYAYGCVICLLLTAIAYWEKISWPLASRLLADQELEEAEERDEPQLSVFPR